MTTTQFTAKEAITHLNQKKPVILRIGTYSGVIISGDEFDMKNTFVKNKEGKISNAMWLKDAYWPWFSFDSIAALLDDANDIPEDVWPHNYALTVKAPGESFSAVRQRLWDAKPFYEVHSKPNRV